MMGKKSELIFDNESLQYFKRNYSSYDYINDPPSKDFVEIVGKIIIPENYKVLEVGCGSGKNLRYLSKQYNCKCYGLEPNQELVNILINDHLKNGYNIKFVYGFSSQLEFEDNDFDLVICWSVLHWVNRNKILQTLGEMLRVTQKYILIMDFCPFSAYKTHYKHDKDIFTYKIDYSDILEKKGVMNKVDELYYFRPDLSGKEKDHIILEQNEYKSKKYDWIVRKRVLFEKQIDLLPIKNESDFDNTF